MCLHINSALRSTVSALVVLTLSMWGGAVQAEDGIPVMIPIPGKNYEMGKYEVTQAEWRAVMGSNPPNLNFTDCGDSCPVERVNWDDIQTFLQRLNNKTGKRYRLPTEAEWEYACYGGSKTEYCGGNEIDSVAWYIGNSGNTTHPVGQKQANGYGLFDMCGNVKEWTSGCVKEDCAQRMARGGSWFSYPQFASVSYRNWLGSAYRLNYYGFRLARTLP